MSDQSPQSPSAAVRRTLVWIGAGGVLYAVLVWLATRQGTSTHDAVGTVFLPTVLLLWGVQLVGRDRLVFSVATVAGVLLFGAGLLDLSVIFWAWPTSEEVVVDVAMLVGLAAYLYSEIA